MDKRLLLEKGTHLPFMGIDFTICQSVGSGASSVVYLGEYADQQFPWLHHQILVKELFPYDPDNRIYRDSQGNLAWDQVLDEYMLHQRMAFERGNQIHLFLQKTFPEEIPSNLNTFSLHNTLYSIHGYSGGRNLESEFQNSQEPMELTCCLRRILGVLDILELFHTAGYLHLDVSPDNILLIGKGKRERVTLIDYNSVHAMGEIRKKDIIYHFEKEGYTAPEVRSGFVEMVGPESDLYSLAAVFYHCIKNRPLSILETSQAGIPDLSDAKCLKDLSAQGRKIFAHIFKKGLSYSVSRRYHSADEFRRDLKELMGYTLRQIGEEESQLSLGSVSSEKILTQEPNIVGWLEREEVSSEKIRFPICWEGDRMWINGEAFRYVPKL